MSDRDIDGLTLEDGVTLNRFVELAEEKSRGHGVLEEPTDVDLALAEVSVSFVDSDGILRTFSISDEDFDPANYEHGLKAGDE